MAIVVVGLNYRTAPVEIREKLTLSGCALPMALQDLRNRTPSGAMPASPLHEAAILSTCNRLEIYGVVQRTEEGIALIEQFLAALQNIALSELKAHLYYHVEADAIRHLMRVACSLDSMILGETQILGQVTQAFEDAHNAGVTGAVLSHLFAQAIRAGKRARSETTISRYTTSVSHAGAQLILEKSGVQQSTKVLLIGAGEMAVLAAQALKRAGVHELVFVNRTYTRAEALAHDFDGTARTWYELNEALVAADAVICATGAPHTIIYQRDMAAVLPKRDGRPLVIMDIAVPRDVEDSVRQLPGVQYYDIDELQSFVDANVALRKAAVPQVETIIRQEITRFNEWYRGRQVTPVIKTLREWAQGIADEELEQTLNRLSDADERTRQLVGRMAHRLVNRLLHEPTSRLRVQAAEGNGQGYAHAVRELFALNDLETMACEQDEMRCSVSGQMRSKNQCNLQCILPYPATEQLG